MCGDCEDQTPVWPEPFCHLTQHVSFIGDVLENIESDDDVERRDWVEVRKVPGGHPQPSATPRGLRRRHALRPPAAAPEGRFHSRTRPPGHESPWGAL